MAPRRAGAEVAKLLSLYNLYRAVLGFVILTLGLADATRLTKIEGYHAGLIWLAVIWLSSAALLLWQVRFIASKADGGLRVPSGPRQGPHASRPKFKKNTRCLLLTH